MENLEGYDGTLRKSEIERKEEKRKSLGLRDDNDDNHHRNIYISLGILTPVDHLEKKYAKIIFYLFILFIFLRKVFL